MAAVPERLSCSSLCARHHSFRISREKAVSLGLKPVLASHPFHPEGDLCESVTSEEIPSLSRSSRIYQTWTSAPVMREGKEEEKTFADNKMRALFISSPPYRRLFIALSVFYVSASYSF